MEFEVCFYLVQIVGVIKYMYVKGIIYCDLKMGNIFFDKYMNVKIGDFGLVVLFLIGKDMQIMCWIMLCGIFNYIVFEILEKGKKGYDYMVDIWSLGIIVFVMFILKLFFQFLIIDEIY